MVPEGWNEKRLGSVLERVAVPVSPESDSQYREIGIRSHGKGIFHKESVLGKTLENKRVFKVLPDCFVVNIVFAWEQAVAKTTEKEIGFIASHRFPMYKPIEGKSNVDFINYFFKTKRGKYLLELASPGGAGRNKTLGQKEFANLSFPMPEGGEQTKIAQILSTWDRAIEITEKLIENSKAQKKALMQQLLTGKKRFPGFKVKWKEYRLKEIANVLASNVDKKSYDGEDSVLLCNYTDVYYNDYITSNISFMEASANQREIEKFSLEYGDVLITKDSESPDDIAIPALVREELPGVLCGYHLAIIRPAPELADGGFLNILFALARIRYCFFTLANGATRFGLSIGSIQNAIFSIPEIEEQKKIAEIIMAQDDEISNLTLQLGCLVQQKKALMQQLLTGKRRVNVELEEQMHA